MRAIAAALLCSCAPVVARPPPASAPVALRLHIDPSLEGIVISRAGAELVAAKRIEERRKHADEVTDLKTQLQLARHDADDQRTRANHHAWWGTWGPVLIPTTAVVSVGLGALFAWLLSLALAH